MNIDEFGLTEEQHKCLSKFLIDSDWEHREREARMVVEIQMLPESKRDLMMSVANLGATNLDIIRGLHVIKKLPDGATAADLLKAIHTGRSAMKGGLINGIHVKNSIWGSALTIGKSVINRLEYFRNKWVCFIRKELE